MSYPMTPFRHLQRLTDHIGLLEHAAGIVPRYEHGYCVDDAARGLVVVCREPSPAEELITLGHRYLHFLAQAQAPDGRFRNRLGYDRRWHDQLEPGAIRRRRRGRHHSHQLHGRDAGDYDRRHLVAEPDDDGVHFRLVNVVVAAQRLTASCRRRCSVTVFRRSSDRNELAGRQSAVSRNIFRDD